MKKKMTFILTAIMAFNVFFYTESANADEVVKNNNVKIEKTNALPEDINGEAIKIENYTELKPRLEGELKTAVSLPKGLDYGVDKVEGRLSEGVSVALYTATDDEYSSGVFVPKASELLTDSKYTVKGESGAFSLKFDLNRVKNGNHLLICISYSMGGSVKNYIMDIPVDREKPDESVNSDSRRISGINRYETNIESVKRTFSGKSCKTAFIASGNNFADALSAGPVAMKENAPVIFSSKNGLEKNAVDTIKNLNVEKVFIVGGEKSVPENVKSQLSGIEVVRIAGNDRYETSEKLLKEFKDSENIIICDGRKFADALSATPLSKRLNAPILLSSKAGIGNVDMSQYKKAYIVGGTNSVGDDTENRLGLLIGKENVTRVAGGDRMETSLKVAQITDGGENVIASGYSFPDALSSTNLINSGNRNLLLIGKSSASAGELEFMKNRNNIIIGGYNSVPKSILGY